MNWFHRIEHKFGHLAIPHLIRVVTMFNALVYILYKLNPGYLDALILDPERIRAGELWRIVSYIFIPSIGIDTIGDPVLQQRLRCIAAEVQHQYQQTGL